VYVGSRVLAYRLKIQVIKQHITTNDEYFTQLRITALFIHLVFSRCAIAGVTPRTATNEVDIAQAMLDAEMEIGVYPTDDEMLMLGDEERNKVIDRRMRRRRYAYAVFIRLTSDGIIN
jgi:hypothetical protein